MNPIQSLAVIIVSADSMPLAYKIKEQYPAAELYSKNGEDGTLPVISFEETTKELFPRTNAILFIGAMGICVRSIAPYIDSKYTPLPLFVSTVPANSSSRFYPVISAEPTSSASNLPGYSKPKPSSPPGATIQVFGRSTLWEEPTTGKVSFMNNLSQKKQTRLLFIRNSSPAVRTINPK